MFGLRRQGFPRALWAALGTIVIVHIGAYMIVPILPIILKTDKGLTASQVGMVIGATSLSLQIGSMLAGFISDRAGRRTALAIGSLLLCISVIGLGFGKSLTLLVLSSLINGIGSGIFAPTVKAAVSALASSEHQTTAFSLRAISANLGTSLGGLATLVLAARSNIVPFIGAAITYGLLILVSLVMLPRGCEGEPCPKIPLREYGKIFSNRSFVIFIFVSFLTWVIFAQFGLLLPLRAEAVLRQPKQVALVWTVMSLGVIAAQAVVNKAVLQRLSPLVSLSMGVGFISIAIFLIGLASNFYYLILIALVFALGEMMFMPTTDSITSQLSSPNLLAAYFSIANIAAGIGSALGSYMGGRVIEGFGITGSIAPWIIFLIYGIGVSFVILVARSRIIQK